LGVWFVYEEFVYALFPSILDECQNKYGNANAWRYCSKVFDLLTIAAVSTNQWLCVGVSCTQNENYSCFVCANYHGTELRVAYFDINTYCVSSLCVPAFVNFLVLLTCNNLYVSHTLFSLSLSLSLYIYIYIYMIIDHRRMYTLCSWRSISRGKNTWPNTNNRKKPRSTT